MKSLLVLVRWHGDIIAVHDAVPRGLAAVAACEGVQVECYDVSAERAALRLTPRMDRRPVGAFMAGLALHLALAAAIVASITNDKRSPEEIAADEANERAALVSDQLMRIAANENPAEVQKDERARAVVDVGPMPLSPAEESAVTDMAAHGSAGSDTVSTSPSTCSPPKAGVVNRGPTCQRNVVITSLTTQPNCFVDTVGKEGESGTLTFPCSGDGEATLTFGTRSFHGASVSGKIDVCTGTEYPWTDGCTWTSAQRVTGSIAGGALQFSYGEGPKPNQGACAQKCDATGTVRIEDESWRHTMR